MMVKVVINCEITTEMMENIANDYLQSIIDDCDGDEELYHKEYENLITNAIDLMMFIDNYDFIVSNGNYFIGNNIKESYRFNLCDKVRTIVLKKMEEDLKNF